ncbi:hypothetical protein CR513_30856, partial [Mucuna pruriens]
MEGKEVMVVSRTVMKRVLLAKQKPLYLLPINICIQLSTQFLDLLVGLPSIKGIEHHIDSMLGATLPNIAYRANPEDCKEFNNRWESS